MDNSGSGQMGDFDMASHDRFEVVVVEAVGRLATSVDDIAN